MINEKDIKKFENFIAGAIFFDEDKFFEDNVPEKCCVNCKNKTIKNKKNYWCKFDNRKITYDERHGYYNKNYSCKNFNRKVKEPNIIKDNEKCEKCIEFNGYGKKCTRNYMVYKNNKICKNYISLYDM